MAENSDPSARKQRGKPFQPGQSGNPGGRPKGLAALVRERTNDGVELVEFFLALRNGRVLEHVDGEARENLEVEVAVRDRKEAAEWLADRGWGKAQQAVEMSGPEGGALQVVIQKLTGGE